MYSAWGICITSNVLHSTAAVYKDQLSLTNPREALHHNKRQF